MTERTPFNVQCFGCQHVWPLLQLPMPLHEAAAKMKAATCPNCGATKHIFAAPAGRAALSEPTP